MYAHEDALGQALGAGAFPISPTSPPPPGGGETRVELTVLRLDKDGRPGISNAQVRVLAIFPMPIPPRVRPALPPPSPPPPLQIASGLTGVDGRLRFTASTQVAPPPQKYRFVIEPGVSGVDFEPEVIEVVFGRRSEPVVGIWPKGADPLICEISEKQMRAAEELAVLNRQWGRTAFSIDVAHTGLSADVPRHPRLTTPPLSWIEDVSWGLMDFAIPLADWDSLLLERARVFKLLSRIPFPDIGGKAWFFR